MSALILLALPIFSDISFQPDAKEIARLVKDLGSNEFRTRQAATKRLTEIGEPGLDALYQVTSPLEMRRRAEAIIAVIETKVYGPELDLVGYGGLINTISLSADGKRLLTIEKNTGSPLQIWDTYSGAKVHEMRVPSGRWLVGALLSRDGKNVLSGCQDRGLIFKDYGTLHLSDAATGKVLLTMHGDRGAELTCFSFGPDGVAISGYGKTINVWDLRTAKKTAVLTGHTQNVCAIAYSDKAKLAATSGLDESLRLWNLETGKEVRLWNLETGKEVRKLHPEYDSSTSRTRISFSQDGRRLMSEETYGRLSIWDVETGKELKRLFRPWGYFSPDGRRFFFSDGMKTLRLCDVETEKKELRKYQCGANWITDVAFFPNGRRVAYADSDGIVHIRRAPR